MYKISFGGWDSIWKLFKPSKTILKLAITDSECSSDRLHGAECQVHQPVDKRAPGRRKIVILAPVGPVEFDTNVLITKGASVAGWPSGHALDSEEAIAFATNQLVSPLPPPFLMQECQSSLLS